MPFFVASQSDVSICLGINTAGIEVALSGGNSVYWVPDGFNCDQLENVTDSTLVYHNLDNLLLDIKKYIINKDTNISIGDHSEILDEIDPWQDGQGYKRVGFYLKEYLNAINNSENNSISIQKANQLYAKKWGSDKIIQYNSL